jgi:hypothetical protein
MASRAAIGAAGSVRIWAQLLHHLVGDFVVAPHGLHVVIVVQHVDQLEQRCGGLFVENDGEVGLPRQLDVSASPSTPSSALATSCSASIAVQMVAVLA